MPVYDKIRMAARDPNCRFAVFPDGGGRVYSPMNGPVFLRPGTASTGVRDIDDGLLALDDCVVEDGYFRPADKIDPVRCAVKSTIDLAGEFARHTIMTKMFLGAEGFPAEVPRHIVRGVWQGSSRSNRIFGCDMTVSGTSQTYQLGGSISLQKPEDFNLKNTTAIRVGGSYNVPLEDICGKWFVMAATMDAENKLLSLFFNGNRVYSLDLAKWMNGHVLFAWSDDDLSRYVKIGSDEMTVSAVNKPTGVRYAWGMLFDRVLDDAEIRYLSQC